jgi:short-subunit dehydrogenase
MQHKSMTVALTGACGGIGRALACGLVDAGASVYLCDRDGQAIARLLDELHQRAKPDQVIRGDVVDLTDDAQIDGWMRAIEQYPKPVNVLVNNAGIARFDLFDKLESRDIEQIMYLNSTVPMKLTRHFLPGLRAQPEARVVNIGSTFGAIGFPGYSVYSASKYAVRGFSEALARELSDSNIRVGCFMPRATQTAINPPQVVALNQRLSVAMDPPEVVAEALLAFLSSKRSLQAFGWPEKLLVRVNSIFPGLIGYAIGKQLPVIKEYAA